MKDEMLSLGQTLVFGMLDKMLDALDQGLKNILVSCLFFDVVFVRKYSCPKLPNKRLKVFFRSCFPNFSVQKFSILM